MTISSHKVTRPDGMGHRLPPITLRMRETLLGWLFLSPMLAGYLLFFLAPLMAVFFYAMTEWNLLSQQADWVGWNNYTEILSDNPDFWQVFRNSLVFAIGLVPLNLALALALALALYRPKPGVIFFRVLFFAPVITAAAAWAIVWKFLLQGDGGALNQTLAFVAIDGPNWLREPEWAMAAVIITRVVKTVGLNMILYIAALQAIPRDYIAAAKLEGASDMQVFWRVTWPLLAPATLAIGIITMIGSLKVFDHIYLMTAGGPENGTMVLAFYIYQQAFEFFSIGYASALSVVLFCIILMLTLIQLFIQRRRAFYG